MDFLELYSEGGMVAVVGAMKIKDRANRFMKYLKKQKRQNR